MGERPRLPEQLQRLATLLAIGTFLRMTVAARQRCRSARLHRRTILSPALLNRWRHGMLSALAAGEGGDAQPRVQRSLCVCVCACVCVCDCDAPAVTKTSVLHFPEPDLGTYSELFETVWSARRGLRASLHAVLCFSSELESITCAEFSLNPKIHQK
jgi:hypothetical protein